MPKETSADPRLLKAASSATVFFRRIRHKVTSSKVRAPIVWWRHRGLKSCDVMLASYPRSGSTWLRFTLFEIMTGRSSNFADVNAALRGLSDHRFGWPLLPGDGRLIGTHEPYRSDYRRAVYLVRDVRDVALSEFAFENNLGIGHVQLDDYLNEMLLGRKRHGSWQNHVCSWIDSPLSASGNLHMLRYEDLRQNPVESLLKLLDFLGVKADEHLVEDSVANNSVQRMREKEDLLYRQPNYTSVARRPQRSVNPGGRFVRSGTVAGWQGELSCEQLESIKHYAGAALARVGYPVDSLSTINAVKSEVVIAG